jgi:ABC-type glycerol-3-phosphate transport system substrate-binding protein
MVWQAISRRKLLYGVALSSAAALATACSGGAPAQPTQAPAPAATQAPPPTAAPAPTAAPTAAPTTAPAAAPTTAPTVAPTTAPAAATATPAVAAQAQASSGGPVTIRIAASWTGSGEKQIWQTLFSTFAQNHPNIKMDLDLSSAEGAYDQKLFAQVAAGTLPDIIYTTDNYVLPFKQNKITQDMLPFARATKFPVDDFDKTFLDLGMVEGQLHMLPRGGDVVVLFINKKMVKDAGVEIPWGLDYTSASWTEDDFYKVCQRLTVDSSGKRGNEKGFDKTNVNIYGAAISTTWWAVYVPAILAHGGQLVAPDLSKSLMNTPQGVAAFEWLTKPVVDGYGLRKAS